MGVELGLLVGIIGCFVGLAGWLAGRDKKISKDSEWKGTVNAKLDLVIGIRKDHEDLVEVVTQQGKDIVALQHEVINIKQTIMR